MPTFGELIASPKKKGRTFGELAGMTPEPAFTARTEAQDTTSFLGRLPVSPVPFKRPQDAGIEAVLGKMGTVAPYMTGEKPLSGIPADIAEAAGVKNKYALDALRAVGSLVPPFIAADIARHPIEAAKGLGKSTVDLARTMAAAAKHEPPPLDIRERLKEAPFTETLNLGTPALIAAGVAGAIPKGGVPRPKLKTIARSLEELAKPEVRAQLPIKTAPSQPGELAASPEAISRVKTEKAANIERIRINTKTGQTQPVARTVDAVDVQPKANEVIVTHQAGKILDINRHPSVQLSPGQIAAEVAPQRIEIPPEGKIAVHFGETPKEPLPPPPVFPEPPKALRSILPEERRAKNTGAPIGEAERRAVTPEMLESRPVPGETEFVSKKEPLGEAVAPEVPGVRVPEPLRPFIKPHEPSGTDFYVIPEEIAASVGREREVELLKTVPKEKATPIEQMEAGKLAGLMKEIDRFKGTTSKFYGGEQKAVVRKQPDMALLNPYDYPNLYDLREQGFSFDQVLSSLERIRKDRGAEIPRKGETALPAVRVALQQDLAQKASGLPETLSKKAEEFPFGKSSPKKDLLPQEEIGFAGERREAPSYTYEADIQRISELHDELNKMKKKIGGRIIQDMPPGFQKKHADLMAELKLVAGRVNAEIVGETPLPLKANAATKQALAEKAAGQEGMQLGVPNEATRERQAIEGAGQTNLLPPTVKTPEGSAGEGRASAIIPEGEGTAIPSTPKPGEVIGRADISKFLQEKLNVPIRSGHIAGKWGGYFRPDVQVVRSRVANNLPTIAHEVGHFLDDKFKLRKIGKKDPIYQELNYLGDNKRPDSHSSWKPYRGLDYKRGEGVAEFTRYYLHDPAKARELAPNLFGKFAKILEENPEIKGAMEQAQTDIRRYMEQPSAAKVLSQISIGEQETKGGIGDKLQSFYTATVDALAPIKRAEKEMGGGKAPVNVTESAYELGNLFLKGWMSKATSFVRRGAFDKNLQKVGPGLDEILSPVKSRLDDLRVYMVSKRTVELRDRGMNPGITRADAVQAIKELESPELAKAFEQIKEFQDQSLTYLKDGGLISAETFKKMRQLNQDYVPFYRVFEQELPAGVGGKRVANLWSPVKRIKGSGREIVDPLESIVKNVYTYINLADRNRVAQAFVQNAQKIGGQGKFIEDVPTPKHGITFQLEEIRSALQEAGIEVSTTEMTDLATVFRPNTMAPKGENILTVFHDGRRSFYQVEPTLYRAFLALDNEGMNTLLKALSMPAKVLRAGATLSPEFVARNPIRDQWTAFIQSKYGYVPFYDAVKGLLHAAKKDQTFDYFERSGAMHSILLNLDRNYLQKTVREITGQQSKLRFFNPVQGLRIFSEKGELATRLGEFERGLKKEGTSLEGILRAARSAQELTVNFSRSGAKTQALNSLIAFWNATWQANARMVRAFKENPVRTSTKAIAGITVPSVLLYYVNRDNPNYERLPQWQKDLFWIIPLGERADTFIRIPKPFEMGILFGTAVERSLEWLDKNDPEVFRALAKTIFKGFTPSFVPTVAVPFIEAFANRNLFTGKPIVPEGLKRLSPELQSRPSTSPTLKAVGGLAGISPLKLESAVRSTTGGLGTLALQGADIAATTTGFLPSAVREPREKLQQVPILRGLTTKTEIFSSDVVEQFYDRFEEAERLLADYKNLRQSGQTEKARELKESEQFKRLTFWDEEEGTRRNRLRATYDLLSDLRKRRQQIAADATLDAGQKKMLLEKNSRRVFEIVERKLKVTK